MAKQTLLLLEDVDGLGRSGDIVNAPTGFARNFILPRRKGVIATKNAIRMQEKLQEERLKQAVKDKADSEKVSEHLKDKSYEVIVKVDPDGHMYGSVAQHDIVELLQEKEGLELLKKDVLLLHPIKTTGVHAITLKLKEGVTAEITLKVSPDVILHEQAPEMPGEKKDEESSGLSTR